MLYAAAVLAFVLSMLSKPTGMLTRGGVLESAPFAARSSLGIAADGTLTVAKVSFDGT